jgi:uncharacterized protein (TIGR02145 family)
MKKTFTVILSLLLTASLTCFAVNYSITFTGSGASTTVDSVLVQNLVTGIGVTVPAGNTLFLTDDPGQTPPSGSTKMVFTTGDRILYTGSSGNYKTVVSDVPTSSKVINYYFVACTDGDGNNYKVVTIGTQIWMAEDLKTSKFNDATPIYQAPDDDASWATLTTPAYVPNKWQPSWGHYYNGYAANTANLAPAGWRLATDADWNTLNSFTAGSTQAKSLAATTSWDVHTNPDVPGNDLTLNNSTGFSALAAGYHPLDGITADLGHTANWWTSSNNQRTMWNDYGYLYAMSSDIATGMNVRCVLNATVNRISVTSPAYCSTIQGNTTINISALGFSSVTVYCWQQGAGFGSNSTVGTVTLSGGNGSIVFPADQYPHGPITLRISGNNGSTTDNCYLQLYNNGGVSWNEGMPTVPPAAAGMNLAFSDDFTSMSIGSDGSGAIYYDHKPPNGSEDFSSIPFTSFSSPNNPFSQAGSYLRIRADANLNSAGLISSMFSDKSGFKVQAPCYFECRFIGPNAPGTWPAFWIINAKDDINNYYEINDELDIIEAYGGEGAGSPNSGANYGIASHAWGQTGTPVEICDQFYATYFPANMYNHGIPSTWYESPHVYGCKVGLDYTIYYCDNIEVGRHETLPVSKVKPFYFMINLATGGGWPVDLSRYNGLADMYVDYVRVYTGPSVNIPVTGVNVVPATATISISGTQQLTATVAPSNASNQIVTWGSSNTGIATVSSSGLVTGVAAGSATITVTTNDGSYTATCAVTVSSTTVPVTGVSVSPTSASINVSGTQQLTATVAPSNASNQTVSWGSSNTGIATVSSSGLVTGVAAGSATITVTTNDGGHTAICAVSVTSGGGSEKLTGTVIGTPYDGYSPIENAFDGNTTTYSENVTTGAWAGLDLGSAKQITSIKFHPRTSWTGRMTNGKFQGSNVADFSSGVVDLYTIAAQPSEGWNQVTITNTSSFRYVRYLTPANGYLNVAEIEFYSGGTATIPVTGVSVAPTSASISVGATQQLTASIAPYNATNQTVTWGSSNIGIATVSSSGLVTGVAAGSATITVTTNDGGHTATCAVSVTSGGGSEKLTGTVIGTSGSGGYYNPNTNAFDGNTSTYSENMASEAWAGLDLGSGCQITSIKFYPRISWASRMTNGKFQGSNVADFSSGVVDLYTIAAQPSEGWNQVTITNTSSFRYVRYLTPANGYLNVAEIEFYSGSTGNVAVTSVTVAPTSASINVGGTQQLTASVAPANATNQTVSWGSGNTGVATVSSSGLVTGVAAGSATITATTQDGGYTATCAVSITSGGGGTKLTGTVIGSPGAYCCDNTIDHAFDGDVNTYCDNINPNPWAGLDLGSMYQITIIKYYPRNGWTSRMVGGKFQGSSSADFSSGVVDLYTISSEPSLSWTEVTITNTSGFRYVRYLSPQYGYLNVGEVEFYGSYRSSVKGNITMENNVSNDNIIIYPNPATKEINITGDVSEVSLYSLQGKKIVSVNHQNTLDVSFLSRGLYIVNITDLLGNEKSVKLEIR